MQTLLAFTLGGNRETLVLDVTEKHDPSFTSEVTKHPVESGIKVSDHSRINPIKLSLGVIIVDTPGPGKDGGSKNPVSAPNRSQDTFQMLRRIKDEALLCDITTSFFRYTNMAITNLAPSISADVKNAIQVRIDFEELRIVDSRTVNVKLPKVKDNKAKASANAGNQNAKPKEGEAATLLYRGAAKFGLNP